MKAVREETKKMEARAKQSVLEAIRAEREILFKQFSQLILNFDPNLLSKTPTTPMTPITPITPIPLTPQEQSPKNPMFDKASYFNVLQLEEDNPTNDADVDAAENHQDEMDLSKLDMPAPQLVLCQYVETKLKPVNETITIHMPEEVFGTEHDTWLLCEDVLQFASMVEIGSTVIALYMRYLFDYLKMANMVNLVGLVNPGQVSSQSGTLSHCSKYLSDRLKNAYGDQFYMVPYNPGDHFNGIDQSYKIWIWHGEPWEWTTNASRNVEEDEQSRFNFVYEEVGMDDNNLGDIGFDPYEFANVIGDGDQPLYPGSSKYMMLSALMKLYNLKAKHRMSDVCFTELLILQGDLLLEGNTLPSSMYEAKKILSALGMSYEKIYACPNDYNLYRNDYEDSTNCPTCGVSRWKEGKDAILKEGVPAKVVRYFPPILRFKRMFQSHKTAKSLT
ncbi:hypothetical protein L3X38_003297 [Prunus dulcis]|uniref:Uncharacterized protein n=1 Tax=Prunus dulcis TaxID=3755 RepID=A0AAD4ZLT1_PRUDU|nr:hypothetical protein L3X38_003297 [Prunus dulcis]